MKVSKFRALLLLLFVMSLIAAACGGGDDADATTAAPADDGGAAATTAAPADDGGTATTAAASGEAVEVRWFVGLGSGTDAEVIPLQEAVVEQFNSTKPLGENISLKLDIAPTKDQGATLLQTQIVGGNAPDIVGPVGVGGAAQFFGGWLDVMPYLADYDFSDFDPALVEFWNQGGVQLGLPFAVFPQVLWYNKVLFDEAGLAYPPAEFGAPYIDADGNEKPWNLDTLRELAMELTVDSSGLTPNDPGFDPDARVQWGFGNQWSDFRGIATLFGAGNFVDTDNETCVFPEEWQTAAKWYHDGMWVDYFYPDPIFGESELLGSGNWFNSGNMGMITIHTWFGGWGTDQLQNDDFDVAAIPANAAGVITAKLHGDTFAIPSATKNPAEAVEVLKWMLSPEIAPQLAAIYGGLPARISKQADYINDPANDVGYDWNVAVNALSHPDNPNHEAWWPNYLESTDTMNAWWTELINDQNADVAASVDGFCATLQPVFDREA